MEFLELLLKTIIMSASFSEEMFDTKDKINYHLPNDTIPKYYMIKLKVDLEKNIFHGVSSISIIIYKQTKAISLHSKYLDIIENTTTIENSEGTKHVASMNFSLSKIDVITFNFDDELSPGNYSLNMEFMGNISDMNAPIKGGFFKIPFINKKENKELFVATHNWATGIRRTFPCWDEPGIRARFRIIIQHHKKYTALTNAPYTTRVFVNNDIVETHFEETPAIPIYLVAIALCNLPTTIVSGTANLGGRQQSEHVLKFARRVIENVTYYFQKEWKLSMFQTEEHVVIPGLIDDGMAKWGLTFYREDDIIYDEEKDNIARKMEVACLIGRKIALQFLNSKTSPSWWSYFWLNEGIATVLFISDVIDKIIPDSRMSDLFIVRDLQESLYFDGQKINVEIIRSRMSSEYYSTKHSIINSNCPFAYYIKVPAILRMLQHLVSDQVFRGGIDLYLKKQSASLNYFWIAMQTAYNKTHQNTSPKMNIKEIIYPWIFRNYPVLNVSLDYKDKPYLTMTMSENASETRWIIPTTFTTSWDINFNNLSSTFIKSGETHALFDLRLKHGWVISNLQQTGYYRVNYDTENWRRIACYLNSNNYKNIHVLNRAQIIDDAFYFTITGQLNASIFLVLTRYLWWETEYVAWYPMIKAIERMSYIFPFPYKSESFKTSMIVQLDPLLKTIGYSDEPNDSYFRKCLRQEAAKWLCVLNHHNCKNMALNKLQQHLTDVFQISPGWRKWIYCNGLSIANETDVLKSVYHMYKYETLFRKEPKNLEFLACSKHFYINFIIMKSEEYDERIFKNIREDSTDNINFFHYNVARHARDNLVLDHMFENWETTKPKEISTTTALIDIINHVYSKEQLDKVETFVKKIKIELLLEFTISSNLQSFNSKLFSEIHEFIRNRVMKLISDIYNKIDVRLSQINTQIDTFDSVFGIRTSGREIKVCDA